MNRSKMKPEVIDRHVAELREHLELMSRQIEFAAGEPVTVPQIVPAPDDLIEEPVFAVGDLVKTTTGRLREVTGRVSIHEVIEVSPAGVKTKDLLSGWESRFDPFQLIATGRSLVPRASESLFREGDKVRFKDHWKELGPRFPSFSRYTAVVTTVSDATCGLSAGVLILSVTVVCIDGSGRPTNHTMSITSHRNSLRLA